ncbi:MAG: hypothetical protein ACTFAL_10295 [Candidatus Electronema sp. V4]|uniref:hypothetical protein n=1 Tax=Candidatus Electronema sp. V4 TaxID=3454756 RepID=UPI00405546D3
MHKSQSYLIDYIYEENLSANAIVSRVLSEIEARKLQLNLREDACDYLYSATVSLGDALRGLNRGLFTWATVKLYYSVFYTMRARLALKGFCIFYIKMSPYSISSVPGKQAQKEKGPTHKVVMQLFRENNIDPFMLSQPIELKDPIDWLMNLRENANYKIARFTEPDVPEYFIKVNKFGVRRSCQEYISDTSALYLFDPDHAMVAYPISLIHRAFSEFQRENLSMQKKESKSFLNKLFSDKRGPFFSLLQV